jgi:hypothetical protein
MISGGDPFGPEPEESEMIGQVGDPIADKQNVFIRMFGSVRGNGGWQSKALSDATNSALQRNPTYTPGTTTQQAHRFRDSWKDELVVIADEYVGRVKDRSGFEDDVVRLQKAMNDRYGPILQHISSRCDPGFRISHAQKSLSLVLKHYWCHGKIEEPPSCPVDRLILTIAGATSNLRTWTSVNTMHAYRDQINFLDQAALAAGESVAVWELLNFK